MSMDVGGSKGGIKADINVTPLVDVMLVLLIIMILIAPMMNEGVSVNPPSAKNTVDKPQSAEQTILAIAPNGDFFLNTRPIAESEIGSRITEVLETKSEKIVLIKADSDASYGAVMAAMDQLRIANVENVGLITTQDQEDQPGAPGGGAQ
jgi:biopolymer transport protein TolR